MKAFATLCLFFFVALASCAAVPLGEKDFNLHAREIEDGHAKYVPTTLPDGRKSISVYNGDVLEGTIVEEPNGEPSLWDADGNRIDPTDIADGDDDDNNDGDDQKSDIERRQSRGEILRRFWNFIRRHGTRAWVSHY